MFVICTSTQLAIFFMIAIALNWLSLNMVLLLMLVSVLLLIYFKNKRFYKLMKRLKWFYLVMFFIFLFNTPGEHMVDWSYRLKPTYEGLQTGLLQTLRIALMLALLSIILTQNTKQQLVSGLYFLLKPLSYLGADVERFAARLMLTLHYVDQHKTKRKDMSLMGSLAQNLDNAFSEPMDADITIALESQKHTWLDYSAIFFIVLVIAIVLLQSGL